MSTQSLAPGTELRSSRRTYTIQRVLGQGGFGITYLVETDLRMGNIDYTARFALKEHFIQMLCDRDSSTSHVFFMPSAVREVESSRTAFISEAQRLQKLGLDHRNIVKVDEVFEANNTAYYVMEYLDGGSLAEYVKTHGGRLSWDETKAMMQPICDAVAMLHRNNVAHYDIKPENIMVMTDKQGLRPVLIDFGLAKHYDGQGEATSTIAAAGYTPGYAPNEQYQGVTSFSPRADVYALSATICYCLTGHAPAKAAELDLDTVCDELLSLGVDEAVVDVLLRAMEFRAADRPADAGVFAAALFDGAQLPAICHQRPINKPTLMPPAGNAVSGSSVSYAPVAADNAVSGGNTPAQPKSSKRKYWIALAVVAVLAIAAGVYFFVLDEPERYHDEEGYDINYTDDNPTAYQTEYEELPASSEAASGYDYIDSEIAGINQELPITVETGMILDKMLRSGNTVIYYYTVDESYFGYDAIDNMQANSYAIKSGIIDMMKTDSEMRTFVVLLSSYNFNVSFVYTGSDSGNSMVCSITADEIKNL